MIKKLLHAIEQQTGLNMQHNHDFVSLSQQILSVCTNLLVIQRLNAYGDMSIRRTLNLEPTH